MVATVLLATSLVALMPGETLVQLRDRVRAMPAEARSNGVEVVIPPGTYPLREALVLDGRDSGVPGRPIVWRAEDPLRRPRLEGGIDLPLEKFRLVSDPQLLARLDESARGKVLEADLADFDFAMPIRPDVGHEVKGPLEVPDVFVNGRRLALATFPSEGWCEIREILDHGSRTAAPTAESAPKPTGEPLRGGRFRYAEDRPGVWKGPVLLEGFWAYDWSATMIWTKEIDASAKTISLLNHHCYSVMKGTPRPRRWRALNVFEELNAPGRYAVDPVTKRLYLYPPQEAFDAVGVCGVRQSLVTFDKACDVVFSGIDFGRSWLNGAELRGARRVVIEKAKFSEQRNQAIWAESVVNCTFRTCDITRTGNAGISISAGDRRRLIPGNNVIEDCLFADWGFLKPFCGHAISMWGCGNHARHNLIRNANGYVISWKQNNGVFAYNVVSNTTWGVDDAGAFYKGLNPSMRGNRLEYNYWRDIGAPGGHGSCAIYFDDGDSGDSVFGNVFENCGKTGVHYTSFGAVFSHGGCSNLVENCIFVRCDRSLGGGPWKQELWEERIKGRNPVRWKNYDHKFKEEVDYRSPEWRQAYPELETFLDPYPEAIRKNAAYNNVAVDCPSVLRYPLRDGNFVERPGYVRGHWHTNETFVAIQGDPGFVDYANRDYCLKPDSEIYRRLPSFKPIPFEQIGLIHRR